MDEIYGLILAGGKGSRMGWRNKGELRLDGRYLIHRVVDRLKPQVADIAIICNDLSPIYAAPRLPLIADEVKNAGPLAGVSAGMNYFRRAEPNCQWVAVVTVDCPFLPRDLVASLARKRTDDAVDIVCAKSRGQIHHRFSLWPIWMAEALDGAVRSGEARKVSRWLDRYQTTSVEWAAGVTDPFFNINRPEEFDEAQRLLEIETSGRDGAWPHLTHHIL